MDAIRSETKTRPLWAIVGLLLIGTGVWAFFAPQSFYDNVATYPPFNRHLYRDIGAFTIGLGSAFFIAMRWRDALTVAIATNAVAGVFHAVSHIIDRDLGGRASDPWLFSAGGLALAIAAWRRMNGAR